MERYLADGGEWTKNTCNVRLGTGTGSGGGTLNRCFKPNKDDVNVAFGKLTTSVWGVLIH